MKAVYEVFNTGILFEYTDRGLPRESPGLYTIVLRNNSVLVAMLFLNSVYYIDLYKQGIV